MSDQPLRTRVIRLASTLPVGSPERQALLAALAPGEVDKFADKLMRHKDLRNLSPRKETGGENHVFIVLYSVRSKASLQLAPWKGGIGWSLMSKGKMLGEVKPSGQNPATVERDILKAVNEFVTQSRMVFGAKAESDDEPKSITVRGAGKVSIGDIVHGRLNSRAKVILQVKHIERFGPKYKVAGPLWQLDKWSGSRSWIWSDTISKVEKGSKPKG